MKHIIITIVSTLIMVWMYVTVPADCQARGIVWNKGIEMHMADGSTRKLDSWDSYWQWTGEFYSELYKEITK